MKIYCLFCIRSRLYGIKGEAFAIRAGGRSPRVARQFIELLSAGVRL